MGVRALLGSLEPPEFLSAVSPAALEATTYPADGEAGDLCLYRWVDSLAVGTPSNWLPAGFTQIATTTYSALGSNYRTTWGIREISGPDSGTTFPGEDVGATRFAAFFRPNGTVGAPQLASFSSSQSNALDLSVGTGAAIAVWLRNVGPLGYSFTKTPASIGESHPNGNRWSFFYHCLDIADVRGVETVAQDLAVSAQIRWSVCYFEIS